MTYLFIGGPADGEWREIREDSGQYVRISQRIWPIVSGDETIRKEDVYFETYGYSRQ